MEAAKNLRAIARLTLFGLGVVMTVTLVAATVRVAGRPAPPKPVTRPATHAVAWDAAAETEDEPMLATPYRLPDDVAFEAPALGPSFAPPVAGPSEGPVVEANPVVEAVVEQPGPPEFELQNPAALGPPEDDAIPAPPGLGAAIADVLDRALPTVAPRSAPAEPAPEAVAALPPFALTPLAEELPPPPAPQPHAVASAAAPRVAAAALRGACTPSCVGLDERLQAEVREGFDLGRAGALYAARAKFIGVLRKIALAKDADAGTNRHAVALAQGLRAMDEADDFAPRGDALEAELDTPAIAASHTTPVLRGTHAEPTPHAAIERYSRYAAERLGAAVAGAQSGSMACYGLGKTYARLDAQSDDAHAGRKSAVMHRAALAAHPANYLAANELGVRLASLGRYGEARNVLAHAVNLDAPVSRIHENLAAVERRLGNSAGAAVADHHAEQIAQAEIATGELSRRRGVQWVSPQAFQQPGVARTEAPSPNPESAKPQSSLVAAEPAGRFQPTNAWSLSFERLKRMTGWSEAAADAETPAQPTRTPVAFVAPAQERIAR